MMRIINKSKKISTKLRLRSTKSSLGKTRLNHHLHVQSHLTLGGVAAIKTVI